MISITTRDCIHSMWVKRDRHYWIRYKWLRIQIQIRGLKFMMMTTCCASFDCHHFRLDGRWITSLEKCQLNFRVVFVSFAHFHYSAPPQVAQNLVKTSIYSIDRSIIGGGEGDRFVLWSPISSPRPFLTVCLGFFGTCQNDWLEHASPRTRGRKECKYLIFSR